MSQSVKRSLRAKKPSHYHLHENEESERVGYTREVYLKEYVSPAQELNLTAKLLSKFINSANKHLKDTQNNEEVEKKSKNQMMGLSEEKDQKNEERKSQMVRKKNVQKEKSKEDVQAQLRNSVNNITQMKHKISTKSSQVSHTNEAKSMNKSKHKIEASMKDKMQEANFQNRMKDEKTPSNISRNSTSIDIMKQQVQNSSHSFLKNKLEESHEINLKNSQSKNKLFGRSTFHVAIAYRIHFQQIQESGGVNNSRLIDPTFYAKKLRGDFQQRTRLNQEDLF